MRTSHCSTPAKFQDTIPVRSLVLQPIVLPMLLEEVTRTSFDEASHKTPQTSAPLPSTASGNRTSSLAFLTQCSNRTPTLVLEARSLSTGEPLVTAPISIPTRLDVTRSTDAQQALPLRSGT